MSDPIVSCDWLAARIDDPAIVVLDASWHMPGSGRDPAADFAAAHVPGATLFDIDEVRDHGNPLPHMLPDPSDFAVAARRLGVSTGSTIVVYDTVGVFSAPRAWWSFRAMGHDAVFVLDGGLPRWIAEGHPVETGWAAPPHGDFKAHFRAELVANLESVSAAIAAGSPQILDARPAGRFTGEVAEPRANLRSGHMPGAKNVPFSALVANGALVSAGAARDILTAAAADIDAPTIASCGSGISAAVVALALARLGRWDTAVYDGSWTEWGGRADAAVVTGP